MRKYGSKYLFFAVMLLAGCVKEKPNKQLPAGKTGVLIVNEGNFGWGNADLSFYDPLTGEIFNDIYQQTANVPLGDVLQSIVVRDSLVYAVLNNSAKIEVLNFANSLRKEQTIHIAGSAPRYMFPVNDSIALVTELYANKIWKINYRSGAAIGSIPVSGETNEMVMANGSVFVLERTAPFSGGFTAQVHVIDAVSLQMQTSVSLPSEPNSLVLDNENNLFVLTDSNAHSKAQLAKISTTDFTLLSLKEFEHGQPHLLRTNGAKTQLYFAVNSSVFRMGINDTIPASPYIQTTAHLLYGMNIHPKNDEVYVADVLDYTQPSKIFVYDASGNQKASFNAGIITNAFVF